MDFLEWLISEADKRQWSNNRLAKESKFSHTTMAKVMSGKQKITFNICVGVAGAFKMPPEKVLRIAGLLPKVHPDNETVIEIIDMLNQLPKDEVDEISEFIRFKYTRLKA